jgi:hypothetical protein
MFLNGVGAIRVQAVCAVIMGVTALVLKIVFAQRFGLPGIVWGTIVAYTVCTAIPVALYLPRLLGELARRPRRDHPAPVAAETSVSIA